MSGENLKDDFGPRDLERIETRSREIARRLFDRVSERRVTIFERRWWDDRVMDWAMRDEAVKVQMFRFIDVLPMLAEDTSIARHLQEYFGEVAPRLPGALRLGLGLVKPHSIVGRAVAAVARRNAQGHARRFIAGTNVAEALAAALRERKLGRAVTFDVLGEAVTSEAEAARYLNQYLDLMAGIAPAVNGWPEVPPIDRDGVSTLPRVNISVKLSALDSRFDPIDPRGTTRRVGERLRTLLRAARDHRAYVHVDMESYQAKDLTLSIFKEILQEEEFRRTTDVGIVIQCYLRDAEADLKSLAEWVRQRGTPVWVRLVKGAYWDYETIHSGSQGWPIPVFRKKWQSDANFERLARFLMLNRQWTRPALASHNLRSLAHGLAAAELLGMSPREFELQMLFGMADFEKQALVEWGYRLRVYMPYGELIPGMAYLVRRLLENTSNDSFLRAGFAEHVSPDVLLANPLELAKGEPFPPSIEAADGSGAPTILRWSRNGHHQPEPSNVEDAPPFANEPPADFALEKNRLAMTQALAQVRGRFGVDEPLWIGGRPVRSTERLESFDPSLRERSIGATAMAGVAEAQAAVHAALVAAPAWSALGANRRAEYLGNVAARIRKRRFELAAWIVYEAGKSWREADGDVCEAIDFLEFYAREAILLEQGDGVDLPGEENRFLHLPCGVAAVIAPWNFPLAILTGMTVAALATGNTVVMKPAEQTPIIAARLMEIFREAELPPGVVNFLPGPGETVGAALVEHPRVALIAFTGSRAVGLAIHRKAAEVSASGGPSVKRVIAEMGGKNAIIIDDDADLDEAVLAVMKSAFGYQGQKCSACSRVIVLDSIHDVFLARLVDATKSLAIGPAEDPENFLGPVIDSEALARVKEYIELGRREARLVLGMDVGPTASRGCFVGPHIFADVAPRSRLAQEEIFGPVLAMIRAPDFDEALRVANDTEYALTGGVFSRSPEHLRRASREFQVGNLYLNRGITGALVGRQPFGGFKMSGVGSKAGGREYLSQFTLPKTITENTMRRGFAPPAEG